VLAGFLIVLVLLLVPAQTFSASSATVSFSYSAPSLLVNVVSSVGVGSWDVEVDIPSGVSVAPASGSGFMTGASPLFNAPSQYRWFNLQANGQTTGSLTIPVTYSGTYTITLAIVDLKDVNGFSITVNPSLPINLDIGITLIPSPASVSLGHSVTLSGGITPAQPAGTMVTISYSLDTGTTWNVFITTTTQTVGTGSYSTKAPMTHAVADLPGVGYNGKVYVFGGYGTSSSDVKAYTQQYDPSTNTWTDETAMPTARWGAAACLYSESVYVFGGYDSGGDSNKVEAYNIAGDSWSAKTDLPAPLTAAGLMCVTIGSYIYISVYNFIYKFDPAGNGGSGSYTQLTNAPVQRTWATMAYVSVSGEDRIYLIGGYDTSGAGQATNVNYYYRPAYNDWSSAQATAPYAAWGVLRDNPVINGLIYYGLGYDGTNFHSDLYSYDPSTDTWSSALASATYARDGMACAVVGSKLYAIGGRNVDPDPYGLNNNEQFDPSLFSSYSTTWYPPYSGIYEVRAGLSGSTSLAVTLTVTGSRPPQVSLLVTGPSSATRGGSVSFDVIATNPGSNSVSAVLYLEVIGPGGYYYFDTMQISAPAGSTGRFQFTWQIPSSVQAGSYQVNVGLIPATPTSISQTQIAVN
jgi:hypothetical protein